MGLDISWFGRGIRTCGFRLFVQLVMGCFSVFLIPCSPLPAASFSHILVINSYHQSMNWEQDMFSAIQTVLEPEKNNYQLHVENMDTKRVPYTEAYRNKLLAVWRHKYASMDFRLIIATDDNAFDLMRNFRDRLFPGVPVVFCGVNFFRDDMLDGVPGFTGVAEAFDVKATLETALDCHPETSHVLVINDYLPTGKAWTRIIRSELKPYTGRLDISYSGDLAMADLLAEIRNLPESSLIIYGVYFRDRLNRYFSPKESTNLITRESPVPVYGLLDFNLGHGIVGGNLISGYFQGKAAALIARQILAGTDPAQIPVLKTGTNEYMFDHHQIVRWGIDERLLPANSIVVNRPDSFYREHKRLVWQVCGFFAFMAGGIVVLAATIARRRRAEKRLRRLHVTLEHKVADRTRELKDAKALAEKNSRELMKTSTEMQLILDNSPVGIVFSGTDRIIKRVNAEIVRISGYGHDELVGKSTRRFFVSDEDFEALGKNAYPVLMKDNVYETDMRLRKKDGNELWCHMQGRLIFGQDETPGVIWIIEDISRQVAAKEEKLAMAKKLEQAQRYKSLNVMAGAIAHHYNNIMMVVQGNIELLMMAFKRDSAHHRMAATALKSAKKASRISGSMLTYVGQRKMETQVTDICKFITDSRGLLDNNVRDTTEITIYPEPAPLYCDIDPAGLMEAVLNLVINADESIPRDDGRISLRIYGADIEALDHPVPFSETDFRKGGYVCLEIADNGSGMDQNTVDHIFDPFFSTKFTGRGLGLSVVAGIVKAHKGTMQMRSTPGEGSCLSILMPRVQAPVPEGVSTDLPFPIPLPRFSGTVVFADDNLEVAITGRDLLEKIGFDVVLASDGQEAVDLYRHNRESVVLVILDAVMPNKSGVDALNELKKTDAAVKIILASGYGEDQIGLDETNVKPDRFIQKPYNLDRLVRVISSVLNNS